MDTFEYIKDRTMQGKSTVVFINKEWFHTDYISEFNKLGHINIGILMGDGRCCTGKGKTTLISINDKHYNFVENYVYISYKNFVKSVFGLSLFKI